MENQIELTTAEYAEREGITVSAIYERIKTSEILRHKIVNQQLELLTMENPTQEEKSFKNLLISLDRNKEKLKNSIQFKQIGTTHWKKPRYMILVNSKQVTKS